MSTAEKFKLTHYLVMLHNIRYQKYQHRITAPPKRGEG
jgi:hypothetical protein